MLITRPESRVGVGSVTPINTIYNGPNHKEVFANMELKKSTISSENRVVFED